MSVHSEAAQALTGEIRTLREKVPNIVVPASKDAQRKLAAAAAVSADFAERMTVAAENNPALTWPGALGPDKARDLMAYAEAYGPVADEVEAWARAIRHSVTAARNRVGREALVTYAHAQRLAGLPEHADLIPHVADMRRTLGKKGGRKPKAKAEQSTTSPATPAPTAPATSPAAPVTTTPKQS